VSLSAGVLLTFITQLPTLGKVSGSKVAHLTSLQEMSITGVNNDQTRHKIKLPAEPSVIAVGAAYAASAMNNNVWFFALKSGKRQQRYDVGLHIVERAQHFFCLIC